ncbi:MAG: hypothetical protein HY897_24135 [Deltaproteobacteria bacterium]|nr:hypothetical protein [Deltaproteobacteria bacterium]
MIGPSKGERDGWPLLNVLSVGGVLVILILLVSTNFATKLFENDQRVAGAEEAGGIMWRAPTTGGAARFDDDLGKRQIQHLEVQMRTGRGFRIVVRVTGEAPSTIDVPALDGEFDFARLTDELLKIKQAFEARQEVYLAAENEVPYGKVLKAVAACRDKQVEGGGQKMKYPLFPVVHFADLPAGDPRPTTRD